MSFLSNKKILFFAPTFFGYEQEILLKMQQLGASVDYYDERPKNNFITKAAIRIDRRLLKNKIMSYYHKIFERTAEKKYDYIFVVNIEAMLPELLGVLRKQQSAAKFVLYMWDSIQNKKQTIESLPFFERVYSFDPNDAKNIPDVIFRPLFYIDRYAENRTSSGSVRVDLSFIGTVHSDRYSLIEELKSQMKRLGLTSYFFMYFPSRILFLYKKLKEIKFGKARLSEFNFKPLSQADTLQHIMSSNVILDIQHPAQIGLTMRTIEVLGADKKLITTNADVLNYEFYDPQNILLIDRHNPVLNRLFFETGYNPVNANVKYKYSIEGWIKELLVY